MARRNRIAEMGLERTTVPGVVRGLNGDQRGRYFQMTPEGPVPIRGTSCMAKRAASLHKHKVVPAELERLAVAITIRSIFRKARGRAPRAKVPFTITVADALAIFDAQGGKCALTGMEIKLQYATASQRNPYAPSLDRIKPHLGYVMGNVRITTLIANVARSDFDDAVFYEMCEHATRNRGQTTPDGVVIA